MLRDVCTSLYKLLLRVTKAIGPSVVGTLEVLRSNFLLFDPNKIMSANYFINIFAQTKWVVMEIIMYLERLMIV